MKRSLESAEEEAERTENHSQSRQIEREPDVKLVALHNYVARLSSDSTVADVCNHALDALNYALGFDHADFTMVEDGWLRTKAHRGMRSDYPDMKLDGPGIIVKAVSQKKAIRVSDTRKEAAFVQGTKGMLSELAVPIILEGKAVGVLNVESSQSDAFTDDDQRLVETLAGHVASCLGRVRGAQAREEAEKRLRKSEERYRSLVDGMLDGTYQSTHEGKLLDVNPAFVRMFKYSSKQEMLDIPDVSKVLYFEPIDRASHFLDTGQERVEVFRMRRKDGSGIWVEDHGRYVHDERGRVVLHEGVLRDVTERVLAEEALRESEKRYRDLVELSPDAVAVHDGKKALFANPAAARILGMHDPAEAVGMEMTRFVHGESRALVDTRVRDMFQRGKTAPLVEEKFLRVDGSVVDVEVAAMPVTWHGKPAIQVAFRDITERKLMADKLRRYSQHLEELVGKRTRSLRKAERLAAMGQMAATVAHDLRNPLTGITGAVYYLRKKYDRTTDAKTREMLDVIENDVEYSNNMMTGLVEYSAEVKLEAVETSPRTISEKALALVRIPRKIRVHNRTKDQPKMMLDVEKMTRVSVNIIQNAVEAMPEGGELVIASRVSKGKLQILFSDSGKGITKKAMSKIWVPFSTTKAQGMGLGLPMAKHMVKAHGGSISIRSVAGKGTTVAVKLPIKKKSKAGGRE